MMLLKVLCKTSGALCSRNQNFSVIAMSLLQCESYCSLDSDVASYHIVS